MNLTGEDFALIFIILLIIFLEVGIVYAIISKRLSRGGPINSVTFFGATSEFQDVEQKAAVEHMLDVQADKKMEEEDTGEPNEKN